VWLYRGQQDRFLGPVKGYVAKTCAEAAKVEASLVWFDNTHKAITGQLAASAANIGKLKGTAKEQSQGFTDAFAELKEATDAYVADRKPLVKNLAAFAAKYGGNPPASNKAQHAAREAFDPLAEGLKGLVKQVDLLYKLSARAVQLAVEIEGADLDRRKLGNGIKLLEEHRKVAAEQLRHTAYFHRQIAWLQDRFPQAEMQDVPGLCKVVTRKEIEKADWSLTPGRYVGVAPPEVDGDFDFEQAMHDIHVELADLNKEAVALARKIQANFEELGA